jgi:hypothetical protein
MVPPDRPDQDFVQRLDRLEERASRLSVPSSFKPLVYSLRLHIGHVRKQTKKSTTAKLVVTQGEPLEKCIQADKPYEPE